MKLADADGYGLRSSLEDDPPVEEGGAVCLFQERQDDLVSNQSCERLPIHVEISRGVA